MKEITIVYGNLGRAEALEDHIITLQACFKQLGIRADAEPDPQPGRTNLLFEGFGHRFTSKVKSMAGRARFVVLGTELITGSTFNAFDQEAEPSTLERVRSRRQQSLLRRGRRRRGERRQRQKDSAQAAAFQKRFRYFVRVSKFADATWVLSEHQIDPHIRATGSRNVYQLKFGFVEGMPTVDHFPNDEKDIDFLFSGSPTPYRSRILEALSRRGFRVVMLPITTPGFIRNQFIARSKICLNLRQSETWEYSSTNRFHYHLMTRSLLVTERTRLACELSDYVLSGDPAEFLSFCEKTHAEGRYNERATELYERYRSETSMPSNLDLVLKKTFPDD
jgi:hypothetical protein